MIMSKVHDRGGWPTDQPIDKSVHQLSDWEQGIDAILKALVRKHLVLGDEIRRAIEELPSEGYESMTYYERWVCAVERLMQEKGIVTQEEMESKVAELKTSEARHE